MKKKKRSLANADADWAAYYMRLALDALLAITPDRSDYSNNEWLKHAKDASLMFVSFVLSIDDGRHASNSLRLCADALEGLPGRKLPALSKDKRYKGKFDLPIIQAYNTAARTGKRKAERGPNGEPLSSELYDALVNIASSEWRRNHVAWKRPNRDYVLRRCEVLGLSLSHKPGRSKKLPRLTTE
jgi:hypothetical protein